MIQVKEGDSGNARMIQAEGTEGVRLSETSLGYLSHSQKIGGGAARMQRARREAGEEPKGLRGSGPCAEGPSLCWQLCPASPSQLEASPQELRSNARHFPAALGLQYSVQPCHHLGGTVWLSRWPRSTPSPLPWSLRRPAVVLCTLPGRCQAHIHQTAPGKRA